MTRPTAWLLSVVAALAAGAIAWGVGTAEVDDALPVGDRVRAAVEGLRDSHVYVSPESADLLTDADRERLEAAAAASRPETFVVVWESTSEGGYYLPTRALRQLGAELGRPGYYVMIGRDGVSSEDIGIDGDYVNADDFDEDEVIDEQSVATRIAAIIDENDGRDFSEASTTSSRYWGGAWGTLGAGVLFGLLGGLVLAGVLLIAWFVVRGRLESRS